MQDLNEKLGHMERKIDIILEILEIQQIIIASLKEDYTYAATWVEWVPDNPVFLTDKEEAKLK